MHRFSTSLLALGAFTAVACGGIAELDDSQFPGEYVGDDSAATGGGAAPPAAQGNGGAAPPAAQGNGNAAGTGGSTPAAGSNPPASGSSGSTPASGTGASPASDDPSPGDGAVTPPAANPGMVASQSGGCPSDITVLFNRPIEQGGCAGGACHVPGGTPPDLVSPNVEARLLDIASTCEGRPYIGAGDSFLADKIAGTPPQCGLAMPFFMPQALNAADEACILAWVDQVGGG